MLPAEAATAPVDGGIYTVAAGASGKCVEVAGGSAVNGVLLQPSTCNAGAARQQWKVAGRSGVYNLVNVGSGRCMDVPSGAATG